MLPVTEKVKTTTKKRLLLKELVASSYRLRNLGHQDRANLQFR
jgi:hypothetical protein